MVASIFTVTGKIDLTPAEYKDAVRVFT